MSIQHHQIYFVLIFLFYLLDTLDCCRFGSGPNCAFQCNCNNNGCNQDTGDCTGYGGCGSNLPDGYGWGGPGCLVGNIALNKVSIQSSIYSSEHPASLGNDGDNSCNSPNHYTHTTSENPAWYKIDFGARHWIQNVTVYDRGDMSFGRLRGSRLQILDDNTVKECAVITDDSAVMTFMCNMVGDSVRLYKDQEDSIIHICELVVMGYRYIERTTECQEWEDEIVGCKICKAGKKLPDCLQDCPSGYYGNNCQLKCNCDSQLSPTCDPVSGACATVCQGWYVGDMCETEISELPLTILVVTSTSSSITIRWKATISPPSAYEEYYHYVIRYNVRGNETYTNTTEIPLWRSSVSQWYTLNGLRYNTEYECIVRSVRTVGRLSDVYSSSKRTIKTRCKAPEIPGTLYMNNDRKTHIFTVSWQTELANFNSGCDYMASYTLMYRYPNRAEQHTVDLKDTSLTNYSVPLFINQKQYSATLTVVNNKFLRSTKVVAGASVIIDLSQLTPPFVPSTLTTTSQDLTTQPTTQGELCGTYQESITIQDNKKDKDDQNSAFLVLYVGISMMVISVIIALASIVGTLLYLKKERKQLNGYTSPQRPVPENSVSTREYTTINPEVSAETISQANTDYQEIQSYQSVSENTQIREVDDVPIRSVSMSLEDAGRPNIINSYQMLDHSNEPNVQVQSVYQALG